MDTQQHGLEGPIYTTASARKYPLKDTLRTASLKSTGLPASTDANGGNPIGVAPYTENWHPKGKRQPADRAYGLNGVHIITSSLVRRVILEGNAAKGAELAHRRIIMPKREVIISCGSIRTPQLLMISGIGLAANNRNMAFTSSSTRPKFAAIFMTMSPWHNSTRQSQRQIQCCPCDFC